MPAGLTYDAIATTTLSSAAASVTFSSISGSYTDLVIVLNGALSSGLAALSVEYNGDTTVGNYSYTRLQGNGSTASSTRATSDKAIGFVAQDSCMTIININDYSNSTTYKTTLTRTNSNYSSDGRAAAYVALWQNTAAITSIKLSASVNFNSGFTLTLYGITAA
jgi:hypothetical protein